MCRIVKPDQMTVEIGAGVLAALALGSSLCICLYDREKKIGGMAHVLLPGGESARERGRPFCVDTAAVRLYESMLEAGAKRETLQAKLAGGARLFSLKAHPGEDVGRQNVDQARRLLQELNIPIVSEDTGENYGRTAYFYLEDGRLEIETAVRQRHTI